MALADDLASAKAALHNLMTGKMVAQVRDSDGTFISYTKANISDLRAYIADLQAQVDAGDGVRRYDGPMWGYIT